MAVTLIIGIVIMMLAMETDPQARCKHEYTTTKDVQPTCTEDGEIIKEFNYSKNVPSLIYEGGFKDDKTSGKGKGYYEGGSLYYDGEYKNGKRNGKGTLYNEDGSVQYKGNFKDGNAA